MPPTIVEGLVFYRCTSCYPTWALILQTAERPRQSISEIGSEVWHEQFTEIFCHYLP